MVLANNYGSIDLPPHFIKSLGNGTNVPPTTNTHLQLFHISINGNASDNHTYVVAEYIYTSNL